MNYVMQKEPTFVQLVLTDYGGYGGWQDHSIVAYGEIKINAEKPKVYVCRRKDGKDYILTR